MQAAQDVRLGGRRVRARSIEFTLQDANLDELNEWAPKILDKDADAARNCATSRPTSRPRAPRVELKIDRDTASRYGIQPQLIDDTLYDAFGQRQVAQYFTQLNTYHVILEILPELQGNLDTLEQDLCQVADDGRSGAALDVCDMDQRSGSAALDQPPGPVPGDHHQLQPRARASRSARRPMPCKRP